MSILRRVTSSLPEYPDAAQSLFTQSGVQYDYAIGGLALLSAANKDRPIIRQTAPYRKEQVDTSTSPGEQSLVTWWLRSQSSFHAGTGIVFEEPEQNDPTVQYRFADSVGVNVWTPGQVTLLKKTTLGVATAGTTLITAGNDGSADCWLQSDGAALKHVTVAGSATTVTWGGANSIVSLANDGANYYAADSVGIYKGTLAGGAGSKIWNTGSAAALVAFVKQRLVAGIGNKFYELADNTGAPTLPTAKYTHPDSGWIWSAVAESPQAIYAAGYAGTQSAIYKFVLDTSGNVPTLTSGIITASLPVGEYVTSMFTYLGSYVAIGTNRGVRIATIDTNGDLQYGPLSVDFSRLTGSPGPVLSLTGRDRFVYFTLTNGITGSTGLGCIDLSTQVAFRRWAWATDLQSHVAGTSRSVAVVGASNQLVFGVDGNGSYLEHPTDLEPTGFLQTGNIRFHTLESKLFKYVQVRTAPLTGGSLALSVLDHTATVTNIVTYDTSNSDTAQAAALPTSLGPQEYVALKFTLARDGVTASLGPQLRSYQLKALPGAKRQRLIRLPLLCFDSERDAEGVMVGYDGRAVQILTTLEQLEEAGDVVSFQDLTINPFETRQVVIDDLTFVQTSPPKRASGWGGVVEATLRTVT